MEEIKEYYKKMSKEEINLLFDKNFLNPNLTRESVDWLEEYLAFLLQSRCELAVKLALLTAKIKD